VVETSEEKEDGYIYGRYGSPTLLRTLSPGSKREAALASVGMASIISRSRRCRRAMRSLLLRIRMGDCQLIGEGTATLGITLD
jgi:hypothetical protein